MRTREWWRSGPAAAGLGLVVPLGVAAAWIPFRTGDPNIDVALALVLAVMAVGMLGSVTGAVLAAASAAWWFDFFDTRPYAHPAIAGGPDLVTFAVLAAVGAAGGIVAARSTAHRRGRRARGRDLQLLQDAATLVATGVEPMEVLSGIVTEVATALGASRCEFSAEPLDHHPPTAVVGRDGQLMAGSGKPAGRPSRLALPVWAQGTVVGHVIADMSQAPPSSQRLLLAVSLTDQAGAVLASCGMRPLPPDDPDPGPRLRVVQPAGTGTHAGAGRERIPADGVTAENLSA